jgi:hypothetical protein
MMQIFVVGEKYLTGEHVNWIKFLGTYSRRTCEGKPNRTPTRVPKVIQHALLQCSPYRLAVNVISASQSSKLRDPLRYWDKFDKNPTVLATFKAR